MNNMPNLEDILDAFCCWEADGHECYQPPDPPGSLWCAYHTAQALDPNRPVDLFNYPGKDLIDAGLVQPWWDPPTLQPPPSPVPEPAAAGGDPSTQHSALSTPHALSTASAHEHPHVYTNLPTSDLVQNSIYPTHTDPVAAEPLPPPFGPSPPGTDMVWSSELNAYTRRMCPALTRAGIPCRFPPRRGGTHCINHEVPRPGDVPAPARPRRNRFPFPSEDLKETFLSLTDRASIQAVLDTLIRLQLAGRISDARSRIILRACAIAARNFDRNRHRPEVHDGEAYYPKVAGLLETIDHLLHEAAARDQPAATSADPPFPDYPTSQDAESTHS